MPKCFALQRIPKAAEKFGPIERGFESVDSELSGKSASMAAHPVQGAMIPVRHQPTHRSTPFVCTRIEDLFSGEHERLKASCHPTVTVRKRVDHHEIEMRHGSTH